MKSNTLRWFSLLFGLCGLADCLLLFYWQATNPFFHPVWDSDVSKVAGVPISILGAIAYLIIVLSVIFEKDRPSFSKYGAAGVFMISGLGMFFSIYLIGISIFVIRHLCPYCLFSAIMITAIFFCSAIRIRIRRREHGQI